MDVRTKDIMQACSQGSDAGRLTFPEVGRQLAAGGIERYHADLLRGEKIYYLPSGESHLVRNEPVDAIPPETFDPAGVSGAIRAIQATAIDYRTFCARIAAAGCVGYLVSLPGRRAVYYGRSGDFLVEPFPAAR
jgi:uncharacterized protein YbcV (DUF1398 family)